MFWLSLLACVRDSPPTKPFPEGPTTTTAPVTDTEPTEPTEPTEDTWDGPRELRGLWVTRWGYSGEQDVRDTIAAAAAANFNAVFLQVRGTFDAFYSSPVEPWSSLMTGTLGQDPGWDALAVGVDEAHLRGLELHAYLNVFPFWRGLDEPTASDPEHARRAHPEWVVADRDGTPMALNDSYIFASPGNSEVRAHVAAVAADIDAHYDVDGIHLDYIRYPGSGYSHDAASVAAWDGSTSWEDFQREQVNLTVQGVSEAVSVPVTAASRAV